MEHLVSVAIRRNNEVHSRGFKSHWALRASLDPDNWDHTQSKPGDEDGFLTSTGRFVDRNEAREVGHAADQCSKGGRGLLSSDVLW